LSAILRGRIQVSREEREGTDKTSSRAVHEKQKALRRNHRQSFFILTREPDSLSVLPALPGKTTRQHNHKG
jgi:hypothetical protein